MRNQTTDGGIQLQGTPSGVIRAAVDSGAPVIRGHLRPRRLSDVVIEQDEYRTQSMDYIPIPDVAVRFTVKSRRRSDVVAVFSAMSFGGQIEEVWVRARLDKPGRPFPPKSHSLGLTMQPSQHTLRAVIPISSCSLGYVQEDTDYRWNSAVSVENWLSFTGRRWSWLISKDDWPDTVRSAVGRPHRSQFKHGSVDPQ